MPDELPPISPDLVAAIEKLADDLPALPDSKDASLRLEWLIEALIIRGQLPERYRKLVKKIEADRSGGSPTVRLSVISNKYEVKSPDVPCGELIPLCGARCCSFNVQLSGPDVEEGKLPWVIEEPYQLPRDPITKRCTCMADDGGCTVYDYRPGQCREYDCREDKRVWIDYAKRIPAPLPASLRADGGGTDWLPSPTKK